MAEETRGAASRGQDGGAVGARLDRLVEEAADLEAAGPLQGRDAVLYFLLLGLFILFRNGAVEFALVVLLLKG